MKGLQPRVGVGKTSFFSKEACRGEKWTEKWETRRNLRQEMGVNGKRDETRYMIFNKKRENQGKNRKLQEIQKKIF